MALQRYKKNEQIQYHPSFCVDTMGALSIIEKVNRKIKLMISFQGHRIVFDLYPLKKPICDYGQTFCHITLYLIKSKINRTRYPINYVKYSVDHRN